MKKKEYIIPSVSVHPFRGVATKQPICVSYGFLGRAGYDPEDGEFHELE